MAHAAATVGRRKGFKLLQQQQTLLNETDHSPKTSFHNDPNPFPSPFPSPLPSLTPHEQLQQPKAIDKSYVELRRRYETLIRDANPKDIDKNLRELRNMILMEGIPPEIEDEARNINHHCTLRGRIWQILLRVKNMPSADYIALIKKGPADIHEKLLNDGFRTFKGREGEPYLLDRVTEQKMFRLLNAFRHSMIETKRNITYVQGLNNVVAPFLYVMPELEAFFTFRQFVTTCCPLYFNPTIDGAYAGQEFVVKILKIVDPELSRHFDTHNFNTKTLSLRCVLAFNSTTPPIQQLLRLWDFLIAFGVHLNIICIVAQIILLREELLATDKPHTLLHEKAWPKLNADLLIQITLQLIRQLPDELYNQLVDHPIKPSEIPLKRTATMPKSFRTQATKMLQNPSAFEM